MKIVLALIVSMVLLCGCSSEVDNTDTEPRQTQEIVQNLDSEAPSSTGEKNVEPSASFDDLPNDLMSVRAEEQAVTLDMEKLEAEYRVKSILEDKFKEQMAELERRDKKLDELEDNLENSYSQPTPTIPLEEDELVVRLSELKEAGQALEEEERTLAIDYLEDTITREEYVAAQIELEKRDETLEAEEDAIEDKLESLGREVYDD